MAKFIKFNVVNTANAAALLTQGTKLINVDHIGDVSYNASTGVVTAVLTAAAGAFGDAAGSAGISARVLTAKVTTTKDGSTGVPTITDGRKRSSCYTKANVLVNLGGWNRRWRIKTNHQLNISSRLNSRGVYL